MTFADETHRLARLAVEVARIEGKKLDDYAQRERCVKIAWNLLCEADSLIGDMRKSAIDEFNRTRTFEDLAREAQQSAKGENRFGKVTTASTLEKKARELFTKVIPEGFESRSKDLPREQLEPYFRAQYAMLRPWERMAREGLNEKEVILLSVYCDGGLSGLTGWLDSLSREALDRLSNRSEKT